MSINRSPLRAVREAKGLSLEAVADAAGIHKGYLSRVEQGIKVPSVPVLHRLAEALELDELAALLAPYVNASGRSLARRREEAGITQDELANLAGLTPRALTRIERGLASVPEQAAELIDAVLAS